MDVLGRMHFPILVVPRRFGDSLKWHRVVWLHTIFMVLYDALIEGTECLESSDEVWYLPLDVSRVFIRMICVSG